MREVSCSSSKRFSSEFAGIKIKFFSQQYFGTDKKRFWFCADKFVGIL